MLPFILAINVKHIIQYPTSIKTEIYDIKFSSSHILPFINFHFIVSLQEVGSIIGKKGEIVKRFREEVSSKFKLISKEIVFFFMETNRNKNLFRASYFTTRPCVFIFPVFLLYETKHFVLPVPMLLHETRTT